MMAIFLTILVLQVVAGYICAKGIFYLTQKTWLGVCVMLLTVTIFFPFAKFDYDGLNGLIDAVCNVGYIYTGFIMYFSCFCVLVFCASKCLKNFNIKKALQYSFGITLLMLIAGYINAINPRTTRITIPADKNMRICFFSDLHIGSISTERIMRRLINIINAENPDLIIIGGDVFDRRGVRDYLKTFIKDFQKITSKYKTFAVIGNHEVYSDHNICIDILRQAGISVLLDEVAEFNGISLVGRLDHIFTGRKSLSEIIPNMKANTIVVDHAPVAIDESVDHHAFLHLSGHTHGGQMFPMSIVTNMMFYTTGVLHHIKDTYAYITYGIGFWGAPYRIGATPEVVIIDLRKS